MKKRIAIASILLLLPIYLCSCATKQTVPPKPPLNEFLVTKSIELTCVMDSYAQSDGYRTMTAASTELNDIVSEIGADEYSSPNEAVLIKVSDATMDVIMDAIIELDGVELNLPPDAHEMLITRLASSVPTRINSLQSLNTLAATSILTAAKNFQQHDDLTGTAYVVLMYDNHSSVTVFRNSDEVATSASATFLFLSDDMKAAIADETVVSYVSEAFGFGIDRIEEAFGTDGLEVEYIDGNAIANYK